MDGTWLRRNLRFLLIDLALAAGFTVMFLLSARFWGGADLPPHPRMSPGAYVVLVAIAAVLLVRRWFPGYVLLVQALLVGLFVGAGYPHGPYFAALSITACTVGRACSRRVAVGAGAGVTAAVAAGETVSFADGHTNGGWGLAVGLGIAVLVGIVPIAGGALMTEYRAWQSKAEEETGRRLVAAERLRLAREVHDVVGHSLSIISLQAGVALHVVDRRPEQAQVSLQAIRRTAIDALGELRATLALTRAATAPAQAAGTPSPAQSALVGSPGVPRPPARSAADSELAPLAGGAVTSTPGGGAAGGAPAGSAAARPAAGGGDDDGDGDGDGPGEPGPRAPLTGLGRLAGLLGEVRLCGVPVELETFGPLGDLAAEVDLAAYRIVQESLTNVLRHAGETRVHVRVAGGASSLSIDVIDRPSGAQPPARAPAAYGHGLTGLCERAAELGGWCTAGPLPVGGWRVSAWLPLTPAHPAGAGHARAGAARPAGGARGGARP
jgi:signal transduction histidine kinase